MSTDPKRYSRLDMVLCGVASGSLGVALATTFYDLIGVLA